MCGDPVTMAMIAMTVMQGVNQQNQAVEVAENQNAMYKANADIAREAQLNDVRALNLRQSQEATAKAQASLENTLKGVQQQGTIQTAAGEAGISGNSVQQIFDRYERSRAVNQGTINRNFDNIASQLDAERAGTAATFKTRVNSLQKGYAPSAFDAGLGIAAKAGSVYMMGSSGLKEGESVFGKDAFVRGTDKMFGKGTGASFLGKFTN